MPTLPTMPAPAAAATTIGPELAALVDANAWTFGPVATALRVAKLAMARRADPAELFLPLLAQCPRMAPLGYWLNGLAARAWPLEGIGADVAARIEVLARHLEAQLGAAAKVLLVGHDVELEALWGLPGTPPRCYRYLLLEGPPGAEAPGAYTRFHPRPSDGGGFGEPFPFDRLEDALDWADAVVLAGFVMHRQNLLGPPQLRPLLATARDQAEVVVLCMPYERRLTLGEGAPRSYREDFRPYLWQSSVTHMVSEWQSGAGGTALGWLPLPPEQLQARLGETLVGT